MRILIIHKDQPIINRLLLSFNNKQNIEIIDIVRKIEEGINILNKMQVDIVIVNYLLIENQLIEQCYNCISNTNNVKKIIIYSIEKKDLYYNAFKMGINYVIPNNNISLISELLDKKIDYYYNPTAIEKVREEFIRLKKLEEQFEVERNKSILTSREIEILSLKDKGLTQSEIAEELVLSIRTVKNHINSILKKMNVKSSKEAVKKAKEFGIL